MSTDDADAEAKMWECFAEVFEKEVRARARALAAARAAPPALLHLGWWAAAT
jgi:hypothetical protein